MTCQHPTPIPAPWLHEFCQTNLTNIRLLWRSYNDFRQIQSGLAAVQSALCPTPARLTSIGTPPIASSYIGTT